MLASYIFLLNYVSFHGYLKIFIVILNSKGLPTISHMAILQHIALSATLHKVSFPAEPFQGSFYLSHGSPASFSAAKAARGEQMSVRLSVRPSVSLSVSHNIFLKLINDLSSTC